VIEIKEAVVVEVIATKGEKEREREREREKEILIHCRKYSSYKVVNS
jgi:hypothetical protein